MHGTANVIVFKLRPMFSFITDGWLRIKGPWHAAYYTVLCFCLWYVSLTTGNNKTLVTSNIGYSGHTGLFLIEATITVLHTYTCVIS